MTGPDSFFFSARRPEIGYNNAGYQNETFVDAFVNYGKVLLTHYADRVPIWVTFNEPLLYAFNFQGVDNVVHAHAQVYKFYHDQLKAKGRIGIKFNDNFGVPKNPGNASHVSAANRFNEMQLGFFGNPIFRGEQYPKSILDTMPGARALNHSELAYINGTSDFFGIDPYTATVVSPADEGIDACAKNTSTSNSLFPYCVNQETENIYGWNIGYRSGSFYYIFANYCNCIKTNMIIRILCLHHADLLPGIPTLSMEHIPTPRVCVRVWLPCLWRG